MSYDERHYEDGIYRQRNGSTFEYYYINNDEKVSNKDIERIKGLKIPPAWIEVWIARDPSSAIQAIGRDSRGRKQYRYNRIHIEEADHKKFIRLRNFIKQLPPFNKILMEHSKLPMYEKNRITSLMIRIVQDHNLRLGKNIYARTNKSYGISSLRKRHVTIYNNTVILKFMGKSKQKLHYTISNPFYVKSIRMLMKLDGDRLFQYVTTTPGGREKVSNICDADLNKYIQEHMSSDFSIKDFRTHGANYYFIKSLLSETRKRAPKNRKVIKKNLSNAIKSTARQLKHTGAVSRKSYILEFAIELYQNTPEFFVEKKNEDPNIVLLLLLKTYQKNMINQ
jgi:DNA topoisomerase-1